MMPHSVYTVSMPLRPRNPHFVLLRTLQPRIPRSHSPLPSWRTHATRPKRNKANEIHRPSLSGSSVGHLIAEISAMKPGMESLRQEGQTMTEEQRTFARRVVTWVMGVPLVLGVGIVGGNWAFGGGN